MSRWNSLYMHNFNGQRQPLRSALWKSMFVALQFYHSLSKIHVKEFTILVWKLTINIYIKNGYTLKNDVSSEITDLKKDLFVKKRFWRYAVTPVSEKKSEKVVDNLLRKFFKKTQSYISGPGNLASSIT